MHKPTRVLIAESALEQRHAIRRLVSFVETLEVAGEVSSGTEAVRKAGALRPDLVLMDLGLPGLDGLAATEAIVRADPECIVIVLAFDGEPGMPERALRAGARAVLHKPFTVAELRAAIKAAREGGPAPGGHVIGFHAAKAGSGTTVIAVNVAVSLARWGTRVALVDADLSSGDVAQMLGVEHERSLADLPDAPEEWPPDALAPLLHRHGASGLDVLIAPRPERAGAVSAAQLSVALRLLARTHALVLVDASPSPCTHEAAVLAEADRAVLVVTSERTAVRAAQRWREAVDLLPRKPAWIDTLQNMGADVPFARDPLVASIDDARPFMLGESAISTELGRAFARLAERVAAVSKSPSGRSTA